MTTMKQCFLDTTGQLHTGTDRSQRLETRERGTDRINGFGEGVDVSMSG